MSLWKRASMPAAVSAVALSTVLCLALPVAGALSAQSQPPRRRAADTLAVTRSRPPRGRAAGTIAVNDTGHLHVANPNSSSETLIEEGRATGSLPGSVRASLTIGASTVRVGFTIYLHGGTITGHGSASFNAGKGEYASFGGSISVNHGGGRYAHANGTGRVYGSINRNTDNATVQVIGQLHV